MPRKCTLLLLSGCPSPTVSHPPQLPHLPGPLVRLVHRVSDMSYYPALTIWCANAVFSEISFAPLSSTYHTDRQAAYKNDFDFPYPTRKAYVRSRIPTPKTEAQKKAPFPCSPKSLYKLADSEFFPWFLTRYLSRPNPFPCSLQSSIFRESRPVPSRRSGSLSTPETSPASSLAHSRHCSPTSERSRWTTCSTIG